MFSGMRGLKLRATTLKMTACSHEVLIMLQCAKEYTERVMSAFNVAHSPQVNSMDFACHVYF